MKLYAAHVVAGMNMEVALSQQPHVKNIKGPFKAEAVKGCQPFVIQGKPSWKLDVEQYLVGRTSRFLIVYSYVSIQQISRDCDILSAMFRQPD